VTSANSAPDPGALCAALGRHADARLAATDDLVRGPWANPVTWRQPVHTVYVPAHLMTGEKRDPQIARTWGDAARAALEAYGSAADLALELGVPARNSATIGALTVAKLEREPVEDLRIDFEDGFTQRGVPLEDRDADEDARATEAADILADWLDADADGGHPRHAPAFAGIRFRSFDPAVRDRGLRTLVIVLSGLARRGVLNKVLANDPRALRLTLPKVQHHSQVETFVEILEQLEETFGVPETTRIPFEVQVETPQAIVGVRGEAEPARILAAGRGRILSLHYGTYDYSASLGVDAAEQSMEHPVADHAKDVLQVATTAVGVELSDGSTNRIPVGSPAQILDGWRIHHRLVTRHLRRAVRQGWDLHAHQLVTRHLATIAYFRASWEVSAERLRDYVAGDETRWMDEPATAKAMSGYLLRAHACGAVTDEELATTGVSTEDLRTLQVTGRL
jgi:citrate lyase beta subunit